MLPTYPWDVGSGAPLLRPGNTARDAWIDSRLLRSTIPKKQEPWQISYIALYAAWTSTPNLVKALQVRARYKKLHKCSRPFKVTPNFQPLGRGVARSRGCASECLVGRETSRNFWIYRTLAPQRAPQDQLFRILEPLRDLGTLGARDSFPCAV